MYVQQKAYSAAIPYLQKAIRKNSKDDSVIVQLARCYYFTRQLPKAQKAFQYLLQKNVFPDSLIGTYFQCLKQQGKYKEAKNSIAKYPKKEYAQWTAFCDSALLWQKKTKPLKVVNLKKINSDYSEKSPSFHPKGIFFLSNRESTIIKPKTGYDGLPYLSLYHAKYDSDSLPSFPKPSNFCSESEFHCGEVFFADTALAYFSDIRKDRDNVLRSKLYETKLVRGKPTRIKSFIFNDSLCSFYHPCIDRSQQLFFFASDMKGGFGGMDLYVSINIDSVWQDPVNLGPSINSVHDELYPFYDSNGKLFFSSDRPEGMGGFDLFVAVEKKGKWGKVQNLKAPLNSPQDDLGFIVNKTYTLGLFFSNRNGGMGREDIYSVRGNLFLLFDK